MSAPSSTRASLPDLHRLGGEVRAAWRGLLGSRAASRLSPAHPIRLIRPDRSTSFWQARGASIRPAPGSSLDAVFTAVELPDDLLLVRTLRMPRIQRDELERAMALEAATSSPFGPHDLTWGWQAVPGPGGQWEVALALASKAQVRQHLDSLRGGATAELPEVWAMPPGFDPIVLPGFGEGLRRSRGVAGQRTVLALMGLMFVLLVAIAATPVAQLRMRAVGAVEAMDSLVRRAEPATRQRAELVQALDQATALSALVARSPQPLQILNLLTQTLPDDTSLLSIQVDGAKVTINGLTGDAAALMQLLSGRAEFKDVKAPSPATRPLGSNKDLFTIELTMVPPAAPQQAGTPGQPGSPPAGAVVATPSASAPAAAAAAVGGGQAPAQPAATPAPGGATFGGATFGGGPVRKP